MKRFAIILTVLFCMMICSAASASSCTYYEQNGDHSWEQVEMGLPSCTEDGYYILRCTVCGHLKREVTGEANGHSWEVVQTVSETCTEWGYTDYVCGDCGEEMRDKDSKPVGHYWVKEAEIAGSCTYPGYIHYRCDNYDCMETKTETIKAPGHDWKDLYEVHPATCTTAGTMKTRCRVCDEIGQRITEMLDHDFGKWMVIREVDNGICVKARTCRMCGKEVAEEYYPEGTLYRGGANEKLAVKDVQIMLSDCGYLNDTIDGVYGRKTEQAIKDFQADMGIAADGVAWPQTVRLLTEEWEYETGVKVTQAPVVIPTQVPAPVATAAPTVMPTEAPAAVHAACARIVNEYGAEEVVYCPAHQILLDMGDALLSAATTSASRVRALNQTSGLWTEEVDLLYGSWIAAANAEDQETIANGRAMFESYLASQEAVWKVQYKNNDAMVAGKVNELLIDQCVSLCGTVGALTGNRISTAKGYVSVSLTGGWYPGESRSADSILLHNDAVGSPDSSWIMITDSQLGNGVEQAKTIAKFAYPDSEFTELPVGDNIFYYISNGDGSVFSLIASTSTGKAMKIDGRSCTVEQAMSLLETLIIN